MLVLVLGLSCTVVDLSAFSSSLAASAGVATCAGPRSLCGVNACFLSFFTVFPSIRSGLGDRLTGIGLFEPDL